MPAIDIAAPLAAKSGTALVAVALVPLATLQAVELARRSAGSDGHLEIDTTLVRALHPPATMRRLDDRRECPPRLGRRVPRIVHPPSATT
ncbi:MAG: hypothetical protein M3296_03650 [Actinomycetota bacterium]|nr:hypothetical protein [Actinomycetota bacterium]